MKDNQTALPDFPLKGHIPYKLTKWAGVLNCHWLNTFDVTFTEPFFLETIGTCLTKSTHRPELSAVSHPVMMVEWAEKADAIEPSAFIFHISRCGSTLVSQLLATVSENIVLSEVPFFDDLLRLPFKDDSFKETDIDNLLPAAIKYYAQKKTGSERHLFIKTDSWHLFFYRQLRRLYPSVPFVFIYRSPDEVFGSHQKQRGMQAAPGVIEPQVFGFEPGELVCDLDIYLAKVLESYFNYYLDIIATDNLSLFVNYNEGPMEMIRKIETFINTSFSPQDLLTMEDRSRYHSKRPGQHFNEQSIKQLPPCLIKAMELYNKLEEIKKNTNFH